MMRTVWFVLAAALVGIAPAAASLRGLPGGPNSPQPLATFAAGSFPESLAVRDGSLYVSLGFLGEVAKVTPGAAAGAITETYGPVPRGDGLLTGLAFDPDGNLFVAAATFTNDPAPGVFEIPAGGGDAERVMTLPSGSFPNGVAYRDGYLYVSDSALGVIWRAAPRGPVEDWYADPLLAPTKGLGANGIAFDSSGDHLYLVVADSGRLLRLTINDGEVSDTAVLAEQAQLRSADGIALDAAGNLYLTANDTNRLYRFNLGDGTLTRLADRSDGLSYPTQPAFDTTAGSTTLYLANGAFMNGVPDIEAFDVDATGLPLP